MKPWKVQKFFGDVVYDLRNRGLLPVAILLLVAMIAVPFLIAKGGTSSSDGMQATAASVQPAPEGQTAVVSYTPPGLRKYKERLSGLSPSDPFRQQFAESAAQASALTSTVTPASADTTGSTSVGTTDGGSGSSDVVTVGGTKKKKKKSQKTYYFQTDLLVGEAGGALTPFNNAQPMTPYPSQTLPAVVYFGNSPDNAMALFLVSNKVSTVTGPGVCVPSPDDCALLYLAPGQSEDLHYTVDDKNYRVV